MKQLIATRYKEFRLLFQPDQIHQLALQQKRSTLLILVRVECTEICQRVMLPTVFLYKTTGLIDKVNRFDFVCALHPGKS